MIPRRALWVGLGSTLLSAVWIWPLPYLPIPHFSRHMTMHIVVVAVVAPIVAIGLADSRLDVVRHHPNWLLAVPISILEFLGVWFWHSPAMHQFARQSALGFALEQSTFAIASLALWMAALGGTATQRRGRSLEGIAALLLTSMHMTLLGAIIALSSRELYAHVHGVAGDSNAALLGDAWSALLDQQLGGAIMLAIGGASYLFGGLWLAADSLGAHQQSVPTRGSR